MSTFAEPVISPLNFRRTGFIALVLALAVSLPSFLSAQTGQASPDESSSVTSGRTSLFGADSGSGTLSKGFLSQTAVRAETSARLAAWSPGEGTGLIAVRYVFPEGYHQIDDPDFFTLKPDTAVGIIFGSTLKGEPVFKDGLAEYFDETTLLLEFRTAPDVQKTRLAVNALFQICNEEGTCLFPDSELLYVDFDPSEPALAAGESVKAILAWSAREPSETAGTGTSGLDGAGGSTGTGLSAPGGIAAGSLLLFLLMALAGGVLLNVMPCVLPLLSVKALGLVRQAGQDRKSILKHSWLYVAGIEVSFWALAAVVIILQTSGKLLGWGFQFQSPLFVLILIAVIWIFSLSMFDVFVIEAPRKSLQGASSAGARGGYLGSFLTGIFAVLVATPCTAPFLGAALGFAFSQPPLVILAIFSVTGLGLGLPFLLLGIWPGIIGKLPKPGNWMNTFKEVMGFLLLGTAVYLFTTFARLAPGARDGALWWLLFLGFSAWLVGKARNPSSRTWFRRSGQIAALLIAAGSALVFIDLSRQAVSSNSLSAQSADFSGYGGGDYIVFNEQDIRSRISAGESVFLEFTAAWCTTCKVNQRVINHEEVQLLMREKGVVHIKGDLTAYDETLTRWLADFGRAGVPLYVLYRPGAEPHLFPELISVDALKRELEKIGG